MNDHMLRIVSADGKLRAMFAVTTGLSAAACDLQQSDPTASIALAQTLTATALLGGLLKGEQRLALAIEGNGPLQKLHAETDARGHVRGTVKVPIAGLPPKENRYDIAGAIGHAGFLQVVKDLSLKEPYRGMVQLQTSEIATDLAYYLTVSEQVPSSVSLGAQLDDSGRIKAAGGLLIQALPGCDETLLADMEKRVAALPPICTLLLNGESPEQIVSGLLSGIERQAGSVTPLQFRCSCSRRQVEKVLKSMGKDGLRELAEEQENPAVTCEYCRRVYSFSPDEVRSLIG